MPRYFFDVLDGADIVDCDGTMLADVREAKKEAARFAAGLLRDNPIRVWDGHEWSVRVRDEHQSALFEIVVCANLGPFCSVER